MIIAIKAFFLTFFFFGCDFFHLEFSPRIIPRIFLILKEFMYSTLIRNMLFKKAFFGLLPFIHEIDCK